jgi:hypothetical protein
MGLDNGVPGHAVFFRFRSQGAQARTAARDAVIDRQGDAGEDAGGVLWSMAVMRRLFP